MTWPRTGPWPATPLFQVTLALQDDAPLSAGLPGVRASVIPVGTAASPVRPEREPGRGP